MLVHVERRDEIAFLILGDGKGRNSFDLAMALALGEAVRTLAAQPPKALVIHSSTEHFSVGGDVHHFQALLAKEQGGCTQAIEHLVSAVNEAVLGITQLPCPVLGLLDGAVAGFGLSLALSCDLLIATKETRLHYAYGGIGITPDGGGSWHLPRQLGLHRALALALLNGSLTASEAQSFGLILDVVAQDQLHPTGLLIAGRLAAGARAAQAGVKTLLRSGILKPLPAALDNEREMFVRLSTSEDFAEGVQAFCKRRPASFC